MSDTPKMDAYRAALARVTEVRTRPPQPVRSDFPRGVVVGIAWPEQDEADDALDEARRALAFSEEPRTWRIRRTETTVAARNCMEALDLLGAAPGVEIECIETDERAGIAVDGAEWYLGPDGE